MRSAVTSAAVRAWMEAPHPRPPGRYFLGRYDEAWEPPATSAPSLQIVQVSVRYRTGLLGARTLLEVVPAGGVMQ